MLGNKQLIVLYDQGTEVDMKFKKFQNEKKDIYLGVSFNLRVVP